MKIVEFMETYEEGLKNRYFYLDGKRVSRHEYRGAENKCYRFDTMWLRQRKNGRWEGHKAGYITE